MYGKPDIPMVALKGDKETIMMFNKLSDPDREKVMERAVKKGAQAVVSEARMRAPMGKTGTLKENIKEVILTSEGFFVSVGISFKTGLRGAGFYGLFIEKGTKPRYQKKRNKVPLRTPKFVGEMPRTPFLEPAFEAKKGQAAKIIMRAIQKDVMKTAKKYGYK